MVTNELVACNRILVFAQLFLGQSIYNLLERNVRQNIVLMSKKKKTFWFEIIAFFAFILSEMGVGNINVGYPKVLFEQP